MLSTKNLLFTLLLVISCSFANLFATGDSLLVILQEELDREMNELSKEETPPYYISFRVDDSKSTEIVASNGSIIGMEDGHLRFFTPEIRIGDYTFDNTHEFENNFMGQAYYGGGGGSNQLPIENNRDAIQHSIWLSIDNSYKSAIKVYRNKKNRQPDSANSKTLDFSKETASNYFEPPYSKEETKFDLELIKEKLKEYSKRFNNDTSIISSAVSFKYGTNRKYFLSTEGASIVQNQALAQFQVVVMLSNNEGNLIPQHSSIIGRHPNDLLDDDKINEEIDKLLALLEKLKTAKAAEPYAGPAILSAEAAGVFFHEIFGHRVEGHRLEKAYDGQTFTDKIGDKVLPKHFSVYCDPTVNQYQNFELFGSYEYDDQGVKSKKVNLVENGTLTSFLMSRKPISFIDNSNGHGRAQAGNSPVSRQSNLIISSTKTYTDKELRKQLISECKKQKKKYGYYFKSVIGGFTVTDRFNPNVFNIFPSEVYRVYTDGRPDELVVGVELIGTPLTMFSNILSAGEDYGQFSGFCGAESGYLPVTSIAPSIFVKKIETQKSMEVKTKKPILPAPNN